MKKIVVLALCVVFANKAMEEDHTGDGKKHYEEWENGNSGKVIKEVIIDIPQEVKTNGKQENNCSTNNEKFENTYNPSNFFSLKFQSFMQLPCFGQPLTNTKFSDQQERMNKLRNDIADKRIDFEKGFVSYLDLSAYLIAGYTAQTTIGEVSNKLGSIQELMKNDARFAAEKQDATYKKINKLLLATAGISVLNLAFVVCAAGVVFGSGNY